MSWQYVLVYVSLNFRTLQIWTVFYVILLVTAVRINSKSEVSDTLKNKNYDPIFTTAVLFITFIPPPSSSCCIHFKILFGCTSSLLAHISFAGVLVLALSQLSGQWITNGSVTEALQQSAVALPALIYLQLSTIGTPVNPPSAGALQLQKTAFMYNPVYTYWEPKECFPTILMKLSWWGLGRWGLKGGGVICTIWPPGLARLPLLPPLHYCKLYRYLLPTIH